MKIRYYLNYNGKIERNRILQIGAFIKNRGNMVTEKNLDPPYTATTYVYDGAHWNILK